MKKFLIYGLGVSGVAAIEFLLNKKLPILVGDDNLNSLKKVSENQNLQTINNIDKINWSEIKCLILAAGIPLNHKIVAAAQKNNCQIVCDVEILHHFHPKENLIGITGTNGKSTITALTGHIFDEAKAPNATGGNIGLAALYLPDVFSKRHSEFDAKEKNYIIEISSFQLDLIHKTKFHISNLNNITPDHLDRHGSMDNYINSKKRIFLNQTENDFAVIGIDNKNSAKIFEDLKNDKNFTTKLIPTSTKKIVKGGVSIIGNKLHNIDGSVFIIGNKTLKGEHNSQNISFAFANAFLSGIEPDQIIESINNFKGLKHRMQFVAKINDINFINDSKATNAESTENSLKSFENIYWILGGKSKERGITALEKYFPKVKYAFLIGDATDEFAKTLEGKVKYFKCKTLEKAFEEANNLALKDSIEEKNILLSPACASFDQWKNFEERGNYFCDLVEDLQN
ncbi:MAG: UDP-N-acetylmuramoylalanine--D-glutamate ligase [Lentimonas sp.]|jgi:UDP-N-acetylmuramoylalanine--D-glutamate ligase